MINDPMQCAYETTLLAMESAMVFGLRTAALWGGGQQAADEAQQMVSEKILAGAQAALRLGTGGTPLQVVGAYREIVHANHLRLSVA